MESEEASPITSFYKFSEEIYLEAVGIRRVIIMGIFYIAVTLLVAIYTYFNVSINAIYSYYTIGAVFIIGFVYYGYKTFKFLIEWEKKFFRTSYFMKLKTFDYPPSYPGFNDQEILLTNIREIFIRINEKLNKYPDKNITDNFTNVKIKGLKQEHNFDILIDDRVVKKDNEINKSLKKELKDTEYIVARIFQGPVSATDLEKYKNEVWDISKKQFSISYYPPYRMIAVTKTSYTMDAIEYVKNKKNWIYGKSIDLLKQVDTKPTKATYYDILWLS